MPLQSLALKVPDDGGAKAAAALAVSGMKALRRRLEALYYDLQHGAPAAAAAASNVSRPWSPNGNIDGVSGATAGSAMSCAVAGAAAQGPAEAGAATAATAPAQPASEPVLKRRGRPKKASTSPPKPASAGGP